MTEIERILKKLRFERSMLQDLHTQMPPGKARQHVADAHGAVEIALAALEEAKAELGAAKK